MGLPYERGVCGVSTETWSQRQHEHYLAGSAGELSAAALPFWQVPRLVKLLGGEVERAP